MRVADVELERLRGADRRIPTDERLRSYFLETAAYSEVMDTDRRLRVVVGRPDASSSAAETSARRGSHSSGGPSDCSRTRTTSAQTLRAVTLRTTCSSAGNPPLLLRAKGSAFRGCCEHAKRNAAASRRPDSAGHDCGALSASGRSMDRDARQFPGAGGSLPRHAPRISSV